MEIPHARSATNTRKYAASNMILSISVHIKLLFWLRVFGVGLEVTQNITIGIIYPAVRRVEEATQLV